MPGEKAGHRVSGAAVGPPAAKSGDRRPAVQGPQPDLAGWLEQVLGKALGVEKLERGPGGEFLFRHGSSLSLVRAIVEHPPRIEILAPIVRDPERSAALFEGLNEINRQLRFAKLILTPANEVVLAADLLAWSLTEREVLYMLDLALRAADEFDTKIRARFGGHTAFQEEGEVVDV